MRSTPRPAGIIQRAMKRKSKIDSVMISVAEKK
jgi:hypothetical protein